MRFDFRQIRSAIAPWVALAVWSLAAGVVAAQAPNPFATPKRDLRFQATVVVEALKEQTFANTTEAAFDAFFNDYYLLQFADPKYADPAFALLDAKTPNPLADLRQKYRGRFFASGKKGPVYDHLHDLTFAMMKAIIAAKFPSEPLPQYDPVRCNALKYNAMLVIGDLNKEEASPPQNNKPKPSIVALQYMLTAVDSVKAPDYLRVPALLGIARQADCYSENPLPSGNQQALIKSMLTLLKQKEPSPTRTLEAQVWLRRMAAQILGLIGLPGASGGDEVAVALATEMRDRKNLLSLRCACAGAFSDLKFAGAEKVNTTDIALDMSVLAYEILIKEEAWVEASEDGEPNRRRLKSGLVSVAEGLAGHVGRPNGIFAAVPTANKEAIKELVRTVLKTSKLADVSTLASKDLTKKREELEKAFSDPGLPRKVALPKPAATKPAKPDVKKKGPGGGTNAGPLAGRVSQ